MDEVPLLGGNIAVGVVRVGNTVRKPAGFWTPFTHLLLEHLHEVGFDGAPRSYGLDDRGRHVLEFIDGDCGHPFFGDQPAHAMEDVGRLVRDLHQALESFTPPRDALWNVRTEPPERSLVIHHDLGPYNFVRGGRRPAFIDWDAAGPGSALWDLAYLAITFVPMVPGVDESQTQNRLTCLARGYGLDEHHRVGLGQMLYARAIGNRDSLHRGFLENEEPWRGMWLSGHGQVWQNIADYIASHKDALVEGLMRE